MIEKYFPKATQVKSIIPTWCWNVIGAGSIITVLAYCLLLFNKPAVGLQLFWGILLPTLPLIFFLAPGLWRNICPFAAANQIPRFFNFSRSQSLPPILNSFSYLLAIFIMLFSVSNRQLVTNLSGNILAAIILAMLFFAFIGGIRFKGKSGWCTSICPLYPLQHVYGQTPLISVKNSHCEPCLSCTKNCLDFNPNAAYLSDMSEPESYYTNIRKLFIGLFPGFLIAFYTVNMPPHITTAQMHLTVFSILALSLTIFFLLQTLLHFSSSKISALFTMASINLFYWHSKELFENNINQLTATQSNLHLGNILFLLVAVTSIHWLIRTYKKEHIYNKLINEFYETSRVDAKHLNGHVNLAKRLPVIKIIPEQKQIVTKKNQILLNILTDAGIIIESGCKMGNCGSDPIYIIEGKNNISPISDREKITLNRLNLGDDVRMACSTRILGNITISLKIPNNIQKSALYTPKVYSSIKNVIIVGNGIAGISTAETIRQFNKHCNIKVYGRENFHLYNRIAITRLIYKTIPIRNLSLLPPWWQTEPTYDCSINTEVIKIDKIDKFVLTDDNRKIHYDKLIIATGSHSVQPPEYKTNMTGIFTLREAKDAMTIQQYIVTHHCQHPIIIGGGPLALETAFALYKRKLPVKIIERSSVLMSQQLNDKASLYLQKHLETLGISFKLNQSIENILGNTKFTGVKLKAGEILNGDLLIYCAGTIPNTELAENCGLAVNKGIIVNYHMQTNDPDIYAVGDVAEFNQHIAGQWPDAVAQGVTAGKNALGLRETYRPTDNHTILKISGFNISTAGDIHAKMDSDNEIIYENSQLKKYGKITLRNNIIVSMILVNLEKESSIIYELLHNHVDISLFLYEFEDGNWFDAGAELLKEMKL